LKTLGDIPKQEYHVQLCVINILFIYFGWFLLYLFQKIIEIDSVTNDKENKKGKEP